MNIHSLTLLVRFPISVGSFINSTLTTSTLLPHAATCNAVHPRCKYTQHNNMCNVSTILDTTDYVIIDREGEREYNIIVIILSILYYDHGSMLACVLRIRRIVGDSG